MSELAPRGLWLKTRVRDYLFCTSASRVIKIFVCIYDHSRESTNKFITEYCNASLDWIGMFVSARLTIRDSSFKPEGIRHFSTGYVQENISWYSFHTYSSSHLPRSFSFLFLKRIVSRYFFLPLRYDTSLLPAAKTFRVNDSVRSCTCYPPVSQIFVVMNNVEVQLKPEWIHSSTGFEPLPPRLNKRYFQRTVQRSHMLATWLVLKGSFGQRGQAAQDPDLIFDLHTWFK